MNVLCFVQLPASLRRLTILSSIVLRIKASGTCRAVFGSQAVCAPDRCEVALQPLSPARLHQSISLHAPEGMAGCRVGRLCPVKSCMSPACCVLLRF